MEALGRLFDIGTGICIRAGNNGADVTGARVNLRNYDGCTIVVLAEAGTAGDDLDLDLQQHTAPTGGTTADLDIIDHYYMKSETTLDNDETWTRETQTAASEITDAGGDGTSAEQENLVVIEVSASQLSDDYDYISLDVRNMGSNNDKLVAVLYILHGLRAARKPANLPAPLS